MRDEEQKNAMHPECMDDITILYAVDIATMDAFRRKKRQAYLMRNVSRCTL